MITLALVLLLALGGVLVALASPLVKRGSLLGGATMSVFALAMVLALAAVDERVVLFGSLETGPLLSLAALLLSAAGLFVAWGISARVEELWAGPGELFAFLLWGVLGGVLLVGANNLLLFYLGLELSAYATYVLAAYDRDRKESAEGAMKYLVLGALSSAILLYGFALVYAGTGSIAFAAIRDAFAEGVPLVALLGAMLALVGLGFKLARVPFHFWVPDAYQGARPAAAAFLASAPKVAVALGLASLLAQAFGPEAALSRAILFLAVFSFVFGNLWALAQDDLRRLFAYSTVAHMGYLALGLAVGGVFGYAAAGFYLVAYMIAGGAAFFALEAALAAGVPPTLAGWRGLFKRAPALAVLAAISLLSLAGVPGLSGFLAKLYVFAATAQAGLYPVLVLAVLTTVVGYAYYFRVLAALFLEPPAGEAVPVPPGLVALLFLLAGVSIFLGVAPAGAFAAIEAAFRAFSGF